MSVLFTEKGSRGDVAVGVHTHITRRLWGGMSPLGMGPPAIISSPALVSALLAFTCAQVAKVFTHWCAARPPITPRDRGTNYLRSPQTLSLRLALTSRAPTTHDPFRRHTTGKLDYGRLVGSGGMPSSHTALVVGLTTSVGLKESLDSSIFAMCLVFSLVVMYDATGVRLHAGRQAEVLNQMIMELPATHPASESRPLRNSLGHTPPEVGVGAIVGLVVGYIHYSLWITQWGP